MASSTNNIAKVRKRRRLSQQQLADKVGAHVITLSNLERGQIPLTTEWLEKLTEALQVDEFELLKVERPLRVYVGGELSADSVHFWEADPEFVRENQKFATAVAKSVPMMADAPRWVLVRNDSLYPVFREGDVVRVVPLLETNASEIAFAVGKLCVVSAPEATQAIVGYLQRGSKLEALALAPIIGPPVVIRGAAHLFVVDRAIYQPDFPMPRSSESTQPEPSSET